MGFANDTAIGTPGRDRPIQSIAVGDQVLAGWPADGQALPRLSWKPALVSFSQGVPPGQPNTMIFLRFASGNLVCTPDQILMLANGKLKRADQLVPGDDALVGKDGQAITLQAIRLGTFTGGDHALATSDTFDGSIGGHLIQAGGVVVGDFMLQMHFAELSAAQKADGPAIGTREYESRHGLIARFARLLGLRRVGKFHSASS